MPNRRKRKRNPNGFTTDEAQTATLIMTEGTFRCHWRPAKGRIVGYPTIRIKMCDRQALEPATRVFGTSIVAAKTKYFSCRPELFPPDGKGHWTIDKEGKPAERVMQKLDPLLSNYTRNRWEKYVEKCRKGK